MYANQVCSRTGRAFANKRRLNPQEIQFNGVYGAFVGCGQRGETGRKLAIDYGCNYFAPIRQIDFFRWTGAADCLIVEPVRNR
jgi:hypothetical protein